MSTSSTGELLALAERMRGYVQARGGPAKDDDGKYIGTCWPMILEAADVLDRLAATPKAGVDIRPLDWQETFVDRGDGSKDQSGWEADNGFNGWYSIEMYFGSDSYGWSVQFDTDVIGDFDDPDRAKAAAQKHFEQRISLALPSVLGGVDQQETQTTKPSPSSTSATATETALRALEAARGAIAKAPEDTWGMAGDEDGYGGFRCWPVQHELLASIDEAIAELKTPAVAETDADAQRDDGLLSGGGE